MDSLDTLWIMGMKGEFDEAVAALDNIDFSTTQDETLNVFETTIRYMGGLLGAYDISGGAYAALLAKAVQLGDLLYGAFDTPNRMPVTRWRWQDYRDGTDQEAGENTLIAELGSLSLEFTRLSQLTNDYKYFDAIQRISDVLAGAQSTTQIAGLWPLVADAKATTFQDTSFTLGGMADSVYEYLPKQYLLLGGLTSQSKTMYETAIEAAKQHIFFRPMIPSNESILVSGGAVRKSSGDIERDFKGQHLGCFTGGMVGIGAKIFGRDEELGIARQLVDGCIWAYDTVDPTGIMPEVFRVLPCKDPMGDCPWDQGLYNAELLKKHRPLYELPSSSSTTADLAKDDEEAKLALILHATNLSPGFLSYEDPRYILRPEAIESIFILYRITGDKKYTDAAWRIFQHIDKYTKTETANAAIRDVSGKNNGKGKGGEVEVQLDNRMESFWLAETLKYFYAIFSEEHVLDLDKFVLNTEAHPFLRPGAG